MEPPPKPQSALFQVYLRLRPPPAPNSLYPTLTTLGRFVTVEESNEGAPTHITLNPPNDNRRRAVEKFAFTEVFEEEASQLDIFHGTGVIPLVEGVLAANGRDGRDGLLATLGVTGSGKSHTILGSRSQRGLTQLALDLLFRSISNNVLDPSTTYSLHASIAASDPSEAQVLSSQGFLDIIYGDQSCASRATSRAATPMRGESIPPTPRRPLPRSAPTPASPSIEDITLPSDPATDYAVVISMYEVYNDRIYDLLTPSPRTPSVKEPRRRPLLFKPTEASPDRKLVAGLRKVICASAREALMVLEAGLHERRVAGTGSNSVSSRSHGFFCVEVKKRSRNARGETGQWRGSALTIVDLAGSERARDARTQGATLAEAGKINESLMYLGQCLQMQSELGNSTKPNLVPYRQCKLTELLFSNSFPSTSGSSHAPRPQRATMIVAADPVGDFNATSQILRYSAVAREITVPRIPSITASVFGGPPPRSTSGNSSSYQGQQGHDERATMERAAMEIARLSEEMDMLRAEVVAEREGREEAEARLVSAEERAMEIEAVVREEMWGEMEERFETELKQWKARWEEEKERGGEHLDRKVEVLVRGLGMEGEGKENHEGMEELEEENRALRAMVVRLQREVGGGSPTKRTGESRDVLGHLGTQTSPVKGRVRKLGGRKWDFAAGEEGDGL
ncbi:hypothetical protein GMDG_03411 [Pseudogymnoascus destructans 20631-21]|uniref:Kinesin motor domain-containing protein n=2 Tax=Pseudogymnoascus destructans TaxID=655981 RepID=L8G798_PSED2|nr:hypothetical protein GMDG_03411 [Pseudogymnoascus destructans 20631-21]